MADLQERPLSELDQSFQTNGFPGTPPGLARIIAQFKLRETETPEQGRKRFYRRLFGILWFGNKVGEGQFRGKAIPTYVFPESIKTAIRDVIDEGLRDYPNPETLAVYAVTMEDLFHAKWPGNKKK